jgi:hypothetical protein
MTPTARDTDHLDRLAAMVNRTRALEFAGRFPGPLARVTATIT